MSCFIDLTSLSFAVPNKKLNSPPKGIRDLDMVNLVKDFNLGGGNFA